MKGPVPGWKPPKSDDDNTMPVAGAPAPPAPDQLDDPTVGWVVVINGPGKGRSLPLGYGMNKIGRDATQRIALDFGDKEISRENHPCRIKRLRYFALYAQ